VTVSLVFDPALAAYDLGAAHPLRPERFTLAVELMRAEGLLADAPASGVPRGARADVIPPAPLPDADLLLVHDADYIATVQAAGAHPTSFSEARGIGPGDTPAFRHMHEAAALVCAATATALDVALAERPAKSFSIAGGLHHAHRDRAAGFCVYNDAAVAIARVTRNRPGLRVAYIDIDAHHGDGVQEAFYDRSDVLTVSVHESGRYLFPGTGFVGEVGVGEGVGYSLNAPLPPYADDACYTLAFEEAVAPAVRSFRPDVIVAQLGADGLRSDPLTQLGLTIRGHRSLVRRIVALAGEVCGGRLAATGGGGYDAFSGVPRAWTAAMAELLGVEVPSELPGEWRAMVEAVSGQRPPHLLTEETEPGQTERVRQDLLAETERMLRRLSDASPLLHGAA